MDQHEGTTVKISTSYNTKKRQEKKSSTKKRNKTYVHTKNFKNKKLNKKLDAKKIKSFLIK